jgi:predicted signal transduction protein with EAL and GGDEF domain
VRIGSGDFAVRASAGVVCGRADDPMQLLRSADIAMYASKRDGKARITRFEESMHDAAQAHLALRMDLEAAVDRGELSLVYQPIVGVASQRIKGVEALVRWDHPRRGRVQPTEFIPIAEQSGQIDKIGAWVLRTACAEAATWPSAVRIAVNVSPVQFRSQALSLKVASALAETGLDPRRLELEITEAVLIADDDAALVALDQLRKLGVGIALDDFGTGYSSLSYLQRFPFDKIKIDRSFVKALTPGSGSSSIIKAVVSIAADRNMMTTAEGVETEQQRETVQALGCTQMQGYLFSPPRPAAEIRPMLTASRAVVDAA